MAKKPGGQRRDWDATREYQRRKQRELSTLGCEIGPLPAVEDPARRAKCERNFRLFCETYFPRLFFLAWSPTHLRVIEKIERSVLYGELLAMALPRGSGKSCLCEVACLWAMLYGHHEFVALVASDKLLAVRALRSIKEHVETNDLLLADFPEAIYPVRCLEGKAQRANGQTLDGARTRQDWTADSITLATVEGSPSSGAKIEVTGLEGRVVGMKHQRADGRASRPSLVLVDDPQTPESARSPTQCATRERVLHGAVLGLAGPGKSLAVLIAMTVMQRDDLADRLLDRQQFPQWRGERAAMVVTWAKAEKLWERYAELWKAGIEAGEGFKRATAFYRQHRAEMDEGAEVYWSERCDPGELSAIQGAYNKLLKHKEHAFASEYQNDPLPDEDPGQAVLTVAEIAAKLNGHKRGEMPGWATCLTAFIDVHKDALYWGIAAWGEGFTGAVVDYGTEPEQGRSRYTLRDVKRTLGKAAPTAGMEGAVYAGLERLTDRILGREWACEGGAVARVGLCLVDARWGDATEVVYQFCRQSKFANVLLPSMGHGIPAGDRPMSQWPAKPGMRRGLNWSIRRTEGKRLRAIRHALFDANFWKSFLHARLAVAMGDKGCLALWGRKSARHVMLAEHLTAEAGVLKEGRGRTVVQWKLRPGGGDNHWLDCMVGCAVGASTLGVKLAVLVGAEQRTTSYRTRYESWQQKRRGAGGGRR